MCNFCSIKEEKIVEIEVEKSKFIAILLPFCDKSNLKEKISEIKNRYPKARHYCYSYILESEFKYSDDGEPSGTAGKPIYEAMKNAYLMNALLIVVRYFGGTLLGSGRLLRTYMKAANEVIKASKLFNLVKKVKFRVQLDCSIYQNFISYSNLMHLIIVKKSFSDTITLDFLAPLDFKDDIESIFYGKIEIIYKLECSYMEEKV